MSQSSTPGDVRQRVERLRAEISDHDHRYYGQSRPVVSDAEYDRLMRELEAIERDHPELCTPDSPTQRVGAPVTAVKKIEHSEPMLSLQNAFDEEEVREWETSQRNFLKEEGASWRFCAEPKLDGVSVEVVYERGVLVEASTRGDGRVGEDITHNVRTIRSVPLRLIGDDPPELLEVRGEAVMSKQDFAELNQRMLERGDEPYANPRNLTSGTLKQLDPKEAEQRPLDVYFYGVGRVRGIAPKSQSALLEELARLGLRTNLDLSAFGDIDAMLGHYRSLLEQRDSLPVEIDGMVIKLDDFALRERLGNRSRSPRWALAVKFPAQQETTRIQDILVQVGRLGTLTPVAALEPVEVGGVTVSRATLHNEDFINNLDVRIGDTVFVERAGDVIPKVVAVVKERRTGDERKFVMPDACPVCGTEVRRDEDAVAIRCLNPDCPARLQGRVEHFVSRGALDIEGFGSKLVEQLVARGLVARLPDLYRLDRESLLQLDRMGEKSVSNLLEAIEGAKQPPLARLLFALGITHVGEHVAEILARHFSTLEALRAAAPEDLEAVKGIGPEVASSVVGWFAAPRSQQLLGELLERGVRPQAAPAVTDDAGEEASGPFAGRTVLFTGMMASQTRGEAEARVRRHGGRILKSVSKNLDLLVAGEKAGSKLGKAKDLGVRIVSEEEFLAMLDGDAS